MMDINALNKRIKLLKISGWVRFAISAVCFFFAFRQSSSWLTWVLFLAALILLLLSLAAAGGITAAKGIYKLVGAGEFSIQNLAIKLKSKENHTRQNVNELIKIGVFPGAVIKGNTIILAGTVQKTALSDNETPIVSDAKPTQNIDLNRASEQEIANLPGVGVALAKKAIELRMQINGFTSVHNFSMRLGLMPHFTSQIENMAFAVPIKPQATPEENKGQLVDI